MYGYDNQFCDEDCDDECTGHRWCDDCGDEICDACWGCSCPDNPCGGPAAHHGFTA